MGFDLAPLEPLHHPATFIQNIIAMVNYMYFPYSPAYLYVFIYCIFPLGHTGLYIFILYL